MTEGDQDSRTRGSSQVPMLGDVPLFGNAFKDKTELLIVITPPVSESAAFVSKAMPFQL
ncbi:hypothetical protein [Methylocapsa aurea]|uniref:hypothetical protein n=1 Tax=Methylocapsa aurea TaxID=663610 RepID=UPI003D1896AD